ncbi:MAG: ABC transporter permease subunit [Acholeplasmataceae bacterium]|nr:ABC transporter permease subunit [Acholeplasmataceae bacterium]
MKKTWILSSLLSLIFIWYLLYLIVDHHLILPSPLDVLFTLWRLAGKGSSYVIIGLSLFRLILSVLASAITGIILGTLAGLNQKASWIMHPYVTILRTIPVISIVVILLIVLGFSITPYVITFFMVFPIIYQAAEQGIKNIDQSYIDVYKLEAQDIKLSFRYLYYPLMRPYLLLSFLQSFGLGLKVLVMAEYLAQTKNSIGDALYMAKTNLDYASVFAWTIILILLSLCLELWIGYYRRKSLMDEI